MNKTERDIFIFFWLGVFVGLIVGAVSYKTLFLEKQIIEEIVEVVEVQKPVNINYQDLRCTTLTRDPELTYRTDRQTVTLMIECSPDILFYFVPAIPATD